jgi:hypothetical protein
MGRKVQYFYKRCDAAELSCKISLKLAVMLRTECSIKGLL